MTKSNNEYMFPIEQTPEGIDKIQDDVRTWLLEHGAVLGKDVYFYGTPYISFSTVKEPFDPEHFKGALSIDDKSGLHSMPFNPFDKSFCRITIIDKKGIQWAKSQSESGLT